MKYLLLVAAFAAGLGLTSAFAQSDEHTLKLTQAELTTIQMALQKAPMPMEQTLPLLQNIYKQTNPPADPPVAQANPAPPPPK